MSEPVRALILEDNPDDAELAIIELQRAGLAPNWIRVETEAEFVEALTQPPFGAWDLILADNNLPTFDGISALHRVAELGIGVPFIIVSGSIGEEDAVAAMQSGAADYVLKDRLARLGQAARRALERRADQERRADAEQRLQQLERLRSGVELATDLAGSLDPEDVLGRVLRRVEAAVGAEAGVMLQTGEGQAFLVREIHDPDGLLRRQRGEEMKTSGLLRAAVRQGGAVRGADLEDLPFAAAVALPSGDTAILVAVGRREKAFTNAELETLELIGSVAGLAMRNADLFSAAAAASHAKSEFLNLAAHELRTPLSVVAGYVSMLGDGSLGEPGPRWLEVVEILSAKTAELGRLVDSLLTAARLESSAFAASSQELDLVELASAALRRAEPRARLLEATVLLDAPATAVPVLGDAEQVSRIVDNLIDNALTYAGARPWVRVSVSPDGRLEVEDTGPGIPEESREHVFERFYRVNDASRGTQPGTGLGLYIARELAELSGGSLDLEPSRLGAGARFVLTLRPAPRGARTAGADAPVLEAHA